MELLSFILIVTFLPQLLQSRFLAENYFERLGVNEESSDREIRIGFKKMALKYHPDKNANDPDAHSKMVELNEALSILLDPERRSVYEHTGEEGLKKYDSTHDHSHRSYEEYEQFGFFDDEPAIEQLDYHSWEASHPNMDAWLVFFYASHCGQTCIDLMPIWKEVARRLVDIAHVGVVNCDYAYPVCRERRVFQMPFIISYKKGQKRGYQTPAIYDIRKGLTADKLIEFALNDLPDAIQPLLPADFITSTKLPHGGNKGSLWVVGYCYDSQDCLAVDNILKEVDVILNEHVPVGKVNCQAFKELCTTLGFTSGSGYVMIDQETSTSISPPSQNIAHEALKKLPRLPIIDIDTLESITEVALNDEKHVSQTKLTDSPAEYLILFINQDKCIPDSEIGPGTAFCNRALLALRKVLSILTDDWEYGKLTIGTFPCHHDDLAEPRHQRICDGLKLTSQPKLLHLKDKGLNPHAYHDRLDRPDQILGFVEEVYKSVVHTLLSDDFHKHIVEEKQTWFVDFYAPWCHHCRDVWPEWNLASRHYDLPKDHEIHFGKIDCGIHPEICNDHHIRGYPSFLLYVNSMRYQYDFDHRTAEEFVRFAKENLHPIVQEFDVDLYKKIIYDPSAAKSLPPPPGANIETPKGERWIIDFFAPWCSHCHLMKPKYKEAASSLRGIVKFGEFNCELDGEFCSLLGISSYPTIWKFNTLEDCSKPKSQYSGDPNSLSILEFAMKDIEDYMTVLDPTSFKQNKIGEKSDGSNQVETAWLIFFSSKESECKKCSDVDLRIRALSARYREKEEAQKGQSDPVASAKPLILRFGKVDCRASGLSWTFCAGQQVRKFPRLIYYSSVTGKGVKLNTVDNLEIISNLDREMDQDRRETASPFRGNPSSWRMHGEL